MIFGAERLKFKECDRLTAIAQGINNLGGRVEITPDGLIINGMPKLSGGRAEGFNDHRIVMSLSVAALRCQGDTVITDRESINKSYPSYFDEYSKLGGIIKE